MDSGAGSRGPLRVLVTDLDGTLLGGDAEQRGRLRDELQRHPEITVVFATGRSLPSVHEVLRDPLVPRPRWIIGDVGASVVEGGGFTADMALQETLRGGWPGAGRVRTALRRFTALTYQQGVPQQGRCSFYLEPQYLTAELRAAVKALGCSWVYSDGRYFDVLPPRADKGAALVLLAAKHGWAMESIVVAGDSLNDLSLFTLGAHGVVVGNAEPALRERVPPGARLQHAHQEGAGGILAALRRLGWVSGGHPVVIGYHRPPAQWTAAGWRAPLSPNGILPVLRGVSARTRGAVWAAAAVTDDDGRSGTAPLDGLGTGLPLALMPLSSADWGAYFHRACKETLWPVLMSRPDLMRFDRQSWARYQEVNTRFAHHIAAHAAQGATVWLHDYNLWLAPALLRGTRPDLRIGLFHHTPFPPAEVFAALPTAGQIRASLSDLDWAGFHTDAFAAEFRRTMAGAPRIPRTGVHPLGIDRPAVERLARARLTACARDKTTRLLVLSVERLDYAKAPVEKVEALHQLLVRHPRLRGRLCFRLVCPPPEPGIRAYDTTRRRLQERITAVNSRWGTPDWQPVDYRPHSEPFTGVVDHFLQADVLWVTSYADGMNLTAKEYVVARHAAGLPGVLVLSRHAGAAGRLGAAALLTDPRDPDDLVRTLYQALTLPAARRHVHLERLAARLDRHTPREWAARVIADIRHTPTAPPLADPGWM
ncbi:trehalose-6-phosphate synthase [Streptomyces gobitricini]|uniref:Glucosylglycerol-phosphate synthase n=1 Tax=Streptomyces gobitricini TaxID=68211 RepID=A0ABN3MS46_9ACTN